MYDFNPCKFTEGCFMACPMACLHAPETDCCCWVGRSEVPVSENWFVFSPCSMYITEVIRVFKLLLSSLLLPSIWSVSVSCILWLWCQVKSLQFISMEHCCASLHHWPFLCQQHSMWCCPSSHFLGFSNLSLYICLHFTKYSAYSGHFLDSYAPPTIKPMRAFLLLMYKRRPITSCF